MPSALINEIRTKFKGRVNKEWAFAESRSTDFWTHGYHRYPAKFIPQVVKKLLETYTAPGDKVGDVFAGCGTTLVECKVHGLNSVGVDINPVAKLITDAKINPIKPALLLSAYVALTQEIADFNASETYAASDHPRIDYWFRAEEKNKIAFLYSLILDIEHRRTQDFFLCALSNILKNCSRWLQDSTKPQTDSKKTPADPFAAFRVHVNKMMKRNALFYQKLKDDRNLQMACTIKLADARRTRIRANSLNAIITSPPYVTSYEYADIHQLTGYWFEYISDISSFRKNFIGTFYSQNKELTVKSELAKRIVTKLTSKDRRLAAEVANYFNDMYDVALEMHRILTPDGVVCLVVGNTTLRNFKVNSAEAFAEMLSLTGFKIDQVIKRKITSKHIPTIRNKVNGKFAKPDAANSKKVYPDEFIIIARKPDVDN